MHQPLKSLNLISATLLLSVASPLPIAGTTSGLSIGQAQAQTNQDRKAEAARLFQQGLQQYRQALYREALQTYQQALVIRRELGDRVGEAQTLNNIGEVYNGLDEYSKALEILQQALAIRKEVSDNAGIGETLNHIGEAYNGLDEYPKALAVLQQALAIRKEVGNRAGEAETLTNIGVVYRNVNQYPKALEILQQALTIRKEVGDRFGEGKTLTMIGSVYINVGQSVPTLEVLKQALALNKELGNRAAEAVTLLLTGLAYNSKGESSRALEFYQQALVIIKQAGHRLGEGQTYSLMGRAYYQLGEISRAVEFYEQAFGIYREVSDRTKEITALGNIVSIYISQGDSQKVKNFTEQILAISRESQSPQLQAFALITLGEAYKSQAKSPEQNQKAIEFAQQALMIAKESKNGAVVVKALEILASAYASLKDFQKAIESIEQGLTIAQEIKSPQLQFFAVIVLAGLYTTLGDYQKGIELAQQGLVLARESNNQNFEIEYVLRVCLVLAYLNTEDYQKALEFAQQSLSVARQVTSQFKNPLLEAQALSLISGVYSHLGDYDRAVQLSQQSLTIAREQQDRGIEGTALETLGDIYRKLGQKEQAIASYQGSLTIDGSNNVANVGLARIYRNLNMPTTAITHYKQAINGIERNRKGIDTLPTNLQESYLQAGIGLGGLKKTAVYRELADLLLSQGRILEAQQVLELLKVQELRDFTKNTRAGGEISETAFTPTEEQILKEFGSLIAFGRKLEECQNTQCSELSQLRDRRDVLTQQFNQKIQSIEKEVRDRLLKDRAILDTKDILREARKIVEAQDGTVLIYVFVVQDKTWLLWASKGGVVNSKEVPVGQKQLGETVLKFRQLLETSSSDIAEVQATAKQLYDWLIKPLESELKGNKIQNLVFSLDRVTRYIPMSALFDGEKYLVENYAVSTVLSAGLTNMSDRLPPGSENTPVLALGLSDAVADFNPLPNVPIEIDAIVRKQPDDTKGIYPGLEFLNQAFDFRVLRDNLIGRKILHIATHGKFVPGRPNDSFLLLGTGDKLTIPQIETLQDLSDVHLVVLSACETALGGTDQDGVEISGISYYLLNTGAKAVAASLWLVNDASTSQLMHKFYGNLAQGTDKAPITKAQALRQAQLGMLRSDAATAQNPDSRTIFSVVSGLRTNSTNSTAPGFSHPYYWAPFILIGNSL